jgi:hypothetical protein
MIDFALNLKGQRLFSPVAGQPKLPKALTHWYLPISRVQRFLLPVFYGEKVVPARRDRMRGCVVLRRPLTQPSPP